MKKGRSWKIIVIQLSISSFQQNKSFPCLPRIGRNGNQFNKSLSTVILEKINTIKVVSGDNGSFSLNFKGRWCVENVRTQLSASYNSAEGWV